MVQLKISQLRYGKFEDSFNPKYKTNLNKIAESLTNEVDHLNASIENEKEIEINPLYSLYRRYNHDKRKTKKNFDPKKNLDSEEAFNENKFPIGWEIRISDKPSLFRPFIRYVLNQTHWDGEQVVAVSYPVFTEELPYCFRDNEKKFIKEHSEQASHYVPRIKLTGIGTILKECLEAKIPSITPIQ
tara:strand:- start:4769 stop:5326 length:558 start_codon:yes stop_codon:yes gene_type:complete